MRRLLVLLSALLLGASLGAEPLSLQEAVDQALVSNADYQNALLAVDKARNALTGGINWKGIGVSATQASSSASGTPGTAGSKEAASTTTLGLNLPLFDQLGASATVDNEGTKKVSVTANPLAHSDSSTQAEITYQKAVLSATQAKTNLETAVRKSYLALAVAQAQLDVQTKKTALAETAYLDSKARYAKGTVTLAEVRTALQDWTEARTNQSTQERNLVKARADLATRLQAETVEVPSWDHIPVQAAVEALGNLDPVVKGTSTSVQVQTLEAQAQKAKADALWWLDPGLSVTGSASLPSTGTVTWNASVTLSLTLGDWQGNEKAVADRAATLASQAVEAQRAAARASETQALLAVESASSTLEARTLALAQAQELNTETQLLAKAGKATALEVEDSVLGVTSAQIAVFSAWADLYGARLDLRAARS